MMLDRGKELDWFASGEIIVLGVTALVFLTYFIVWELGEKYPIVDLSLFKNRNFTIGVVATSLGFMVYMGTLTLLPLVLQSNLGYTATWAGLAAAPVGFYRLFCRRLSVSLVIASICACLSVPASWYLPIHSIGEPISMPVWI